MTKLISVEFKNFQSYGSVSAKVDLVNPGTTMITGNNIDDGGSNGTGKSTIINAISYGLYDKPISDISKDGLINNINGKDMEVIIEFEKNNHQYRVRRYRKMKGNGVELFEDGNDITPDSISNTNDSILQILNMPYELFVRVIVFSAINTQFLNLPSRAQADMLEELLDQKMLTDKAAILKERIKDTNRSIEIEDDKMSQANIDCHRFAKSYKRAHERVVEWDVDHALQLKNISKTVKELKRVDIATQQELLDESDRLIHVIEDMTHNLTTIKRNLSDEKYIISELDNAKEKSEKWVMDNKKCVDEVTNELSELESVDVEEQLQLNDEYEELNANIHQLKVEVKNVSIEIKKSEEVISLNEQELATLEDNICPYCEQHFENTKSKTDKCNDNIKQANEDISILSKLTEKTNTSIEKLTDSTFIIADKIIATRDWLISNKVNVASKKEQLKQAKSAVNGWINDIEELSNKVNLDKVVSITKEIELIEQEISKHDKDLRDIQKFKTMNQSMNQTDINNHNQTLAINESKLVSTKNQVNVFLQPLQELKEEVYSKEEDMTFLDIFKQCGLPTDNPELMFEKMYNANISEAVNNINNDTDCVFIKGTDRSDSLHKLADHQKFLLKLLTNKNSFIRKTMLSQSIPFLNKQLDGYLKDMGLPHNVVFTPKMEVNISRLGKSLQYGNLSNGQACRVNLALSFAFRDVLQYLHDPINVWILDEVLDVGLDSGGIQKAASMIKRKADADNTSIFVISHRDEINNTFNDTITVTLKDGFSTITN